MPQIDDIDRKLLTLLLADARLSLKEIAGQVGLSSPSASERLRRLQERGVIRRFTVELDPASLGYPVQAIVRVRPLPGKVARVQQLLEGIPEIAECDKVTGDDCFVARVFVRSIEHLDDVLDRIGDEAETNTSVVKSQAVRRRPPPYR